jgi:selenide,water dikinase
VARTGLPVDESGFLQVTDTLQSTGDPRVFAAGDIAHQVQHPRPKAGVYAVRQAPALVRNLRAFLLDKPVQPIVPQRRFL